MKRVVLLSTMVVAGLFAAAQTATPSAEETLGLLENGLTSALLDADLTNIGNWQVTLEGTDNPALQALGAQLAEPIDGLEVGGLLTSLGQGTITAVEM